MKWVRRIVAVLAWSSLLLWFVSGTYKSIAVDYGEYGILITRAEISLSWTGSKVFSLSQFRPKLEISWGESAIGSWWGEFHTSSYAEFASAFGKPSKYLYDFWTVSIPQWFTNLITWSLFFILWRKNRKHPKGHCQSCGYDLRLNESGRCPECNAEATS